VAEVTVEWEQAKRLRAVIEVPDDASDQEITELADKMAQSGRSNQPALIQVLESGTGGVHWTRSGVPGRFGGRIR
jgi:hypothetical protein